jgi:DNA-binding PadR family transcriptional regulator
MSAKGTCLTLDFGECPCAGGTLDKLIQPAILVVLTDGPLHGYRLAERIGKMSAFRGHKPDTSGVYRFLKSMERGGLVASSWDTSQSGPARKSYEITPAGECCLGQWIKTLETYRKGISLLVRSARRSAAK